MAEIQKVIVEVGTKKVKKKLTIFLENGIRNQVRRLYIRLISIQFSDTFYGRVDLPRSEARTKKGARRPRKVRDYTDREIALIQEQQSDSGHFRSTRDKDERYPMSSAPVGRNPHPKNPWLEEEEKWKNEGNT